MPLKPAPMQVRLARFVRANWTALAALGWSSYMRFGRGGVTLDDGTLDAWGSRRQRFRPGYLVSTSVEALNEMIASYDPAAAIIVVVLPAETGPVVEPRARDSSVEERRIERGEGVDAGLFVGRPTPPAAHVQRSS